MATARQGSVTRSNLGFLAIGDKGTWKSEFCLGFLKMTNEDGKPMRVLYIDGEFGSVDDRLERFEDDGIDLRNLYLVYTSSVTEVNEYVQKAIKGENFYELIDDGFGGTKESSIIITDADGNPFRPDAIVVDGSSVLFNSQEQALTDFSQLRATVRADNNKLTGDARKVSVGGAGLEFKDRGVLKMTGQKLALNLIASGKHYAITARVKNLTKRVYNAKTGEFESVDTGEKGVEGFKDLGYNVKTVLLMDFDEKGNVYAKIDGKDRTEVFSPNSIIENPTITAWQKVIDKNRNRKSFVIANTLESDIKKEKESIEDEMLKSAGIDPVEVKKEIATDNELKSLRVELRNVIKELTQSEKTQIPNAFKTNDINITSATIDSCVSIDMLKKAINVIKSIKDKK